MRTIAKRLLFREAAATELWIFNSAGDVAIGIDEVDSSSDANGSALWINEYLDPISH